MPHPGKSQQSGGDDDPAHGLIPTAAAKDVHREQVERQSDDDACALPKIGRETFAARAAPGSEYFKNVENQYCSKCRKNDSDNQTGQNFILIEHNDSKVSGKRVCAFRGF